MDVFHESVWGGRGINGWQLALPESRRKWFTNIFTLSCGKSSRIISVHCNMSWIKPTSRFMHNNVRRWYMFSGNISEKRGWRGASESALPSKYYVSQELVSTVMGWYARLFPWNVQVIAKHAKRFQLSKETCRCPSVACTAIGTSALRTNTTKVLMRVLRTSNVNEMLRLNIRAGLV